MSGVREPFLARSATGNARTQSGDNLDEAVGVHATSHRHFGDGSIRMHTQNERHYNEDERLQVFIGHQHNQTSSMRGEHWEEDQAHPQQKYHKRRFKMNEDNMFNEQLEDKDQKVVVDMINIQEQMLKKLVKISFEEYEPTVFSKQPYAPKPLFNPKNKISISMNGYRLKKL